MLDGFLGRWSRRKQDVRAGRPVQEPAPVAMPAAQAPEEQREPPPQVPEAPPPPPSLADAQALTPASDFKPFLARAVSPEVRNLALKKLFADPHFNVMDGLDIYVGDYTQPDPLPEGMLRKMASARAMGFFGGGTDGNAMAPALPPTRDGAQEATTPDRARPPPCKAIPTPLPTSKPDLAAAPTGAVATPASQSEHDHTDLRLQPDDAPRREGLGPGIA
ncbi:DUF3306 domain-containing protein [Verminephrobacter aporrectodeae subsp. tuberculatae]|uniref:DUF3306 domain-containing protein n=1 Tax=Verminephrobacter aporrectodeae subsp. tuberculatae TaxID=1110392 RepID=A0ABT3KSW0_9BURK|nr:DUF3306 domain-containing protein [Verminephrobacter aporrectodeae]MCW5321019.1 DUF3306 domain-containing protein [Verminephrobacter aporrectodeae subsp. tuberculatae]